MLKHLKSNKGDANVSKMTLVAIIFVVGAILLVMTTSAFRGPINRWFEKVTTGWFADSNGMFEADNQFLGYEKNANGTYKDVTYICYSSDGSYIVLSATGVAEATNGEVEGWCFLHNAYDANGHPLWGGEYIDVTCSISPDGKTITIDRDVFVATPNQ